MLTPKQEQEWESQVEMANHIVNEEDDRPVDIEYFTVLAVDAELTALRQQVEAQRAALVAAKDVLTRLGEEDEYMLAFLYDRETAPVLAAIDAALGKEESKRC